MSIFFDFLENIKVAGLEFYGVYYSTYMGIVVDNNDPEKRGRVKLKIPQLLDREQVHPIWALPMGQNLTGSGTGGFLPPYVGDRVDVLFEFGHLDYPKYMGGYWTIGSLPGDFSEGYPDIRGWVFKSGQKFLFDERKGKVKTSLINSSGTSIVLDDSDGNETITIKSKNGASITISKDSSFVLKAKSGLSVGIDDTGKKITLGDGASVSAVLGEALQSYLDSHIHPTVMGPSGPPLISASTNNANTATSFLSKLVKIKSNS